MLSSRAIATAAMRQYSIGIAEVSRVGTTPSVFLNDRYEIFPGKIIEKQAATTASTAAQSFAYSELNFSRSPDAGYFPTGTSPSMPPTASHLLHQSTPAHVFFRQ